MDVPPPDSGNHEPGRAEANSQVRSVEAGSSQTASIWAHKPWWCQPWSIVSTGVGTMTVSWLMLHRWWITLPLAAAVLLWWWLFLVLVPGAYARGELET